MQADTQGARKPGSLPRGSEVEDTLPRRILGRTGRPVSILGLGGGGILMRTLDREAAMALIHRAIDLGVNYVDTAPTYGPSEEHFGEVLKARRPEVFLATKVHSRSRDEGWRKIENSLRRLQSDYIDLIQVHDIKTEDEVDRVMRLDGALAAMLEARDQGLVRWIGVTGHWDPSPMAYALQRFDFDTVLIPVNVTDKHYLSYIDVVMPVALKRNLGIIAMKVYCAGGVFEQLDVMPHDALRYALSFPVSTAVVGVDDMQQLLENINIGRRFVPMTEEEKESVLDRTRQKAAVCSAKFKREPR